MFTNSFVLYPVVAISFVAAATDLARGKIYNWLTLPAIALGLVAQAAVGGLGGLLSGLAGAGVGLLAYGGLFLLRAMGGGDVKLVMALGAWGGPRFAADVALLGLVLGGLLGLVMMLVTGRAPGFVRRLYRFLLTVFVRELAVEVPKIDQKFKMPYGLPIAAAAIWVAIWNPLEKWGLRLW